MHGWVKVMGDLAKPGLAFRIEYQCKSTKFYGINSPEIDCSNWMDSVKTLPYHGLDEENRRAFMSNKINNSSLASIEDIFPKGKGEPCLVVIPKEIGSNPRKLVDFFGLKLTLTKEQTDAIEKGFQSIWNIESRN